MPYEIHLIVYGHDSALKRVKAMEYLLRGYPAGPDRQAGGSRDRLSELKELAKGFLTTQALVTVRNATYRIPQSVRSTSETGPRLTDQFLRMPS
jgi:hypothetical protein